MSKIDETQQLVGKTDDRVERYENCYGDYSGFDMYFTDGTCLTVMSTGSGEHSTSVEVTE